MANENADQYTGNDTPSLNIMQYAYLLWHWTWLILLVGAIAGGIAYFLNVRITPVYQTSTEILVIDPPSVARASDAAQITGVYSSARTFAEMVNNSAVVTEVVKRLGLSVDPSSLRGAITTQLVTNTNLITISVTNTNPTLAKSIADTTVEVFKNYIQDFQTARYKTSKGALNTQMASMKVQIDDTQKLADEATDAGTKNILATRRTNYDQIYASLMSNLQQVQLAEAQGLTSILTVEPAFIPSNPILPKTTQNTLIAILIGIAGMVAIIITLNFLDDSIKSPEEIRSRFGLAILGLVSHHVSKDLITLEQPRSPISEALRSLRTNLQYASVDRPLRRILITSPTPQDGKTTISSNLAVVFAQGGKKVTIVDGDMRRPNIHRMFQLPNRAGLSDLFIHPVGEMGASLQASGKEGLTVICAGPLPPNPGELLASTKMALILDALNETNDLVIVDTPPTLSVTDAVVLAPIIDGVILVVKPTTKLEVFRQSYQQLLQVGANVLGVVMNDIEPRSSRYGYYYRQYYSRYSYYYSSDGDKKKASKASKAAAG